MKPIHPQMGYAMRRSMMLLYFACVALGFASCASGTKDIARGANNISVVADRIGEHSKALEPVVAGNKDAETHLHGIEQGVADIKIEAAKVQVAVTTVKDKESAWVAIFENITWITIVLLVMFALFYFGLAAPIRAFFVFIGSFVPAILPPKVKGQAKLDAESLDATPNPDLEKSVAIRRASDPMYDAAWKAQRRAEEKAKP